MSLKLHSHIWKKNIWKNNKRTWETYQIISHRFIDLLIFYWYCCEKESDSGFILETNLPTALFDQPALSLPGFLQFLHKPLKHMNAVFQWCFVEFWVTKNNNFVIRSIKVECHILLHRSVIFLIWKVMTTKTWYDFLGYIFILGHTSKFFLYRLIAGTCTLN